MRSTLFASCVLAMLPATAAAAAVTSRPDPFKRQHTPSASSTPAPNFGQFTPRSAATVTRLDYAIWDEALGFFVMDMGPSLRKGAPSREPYTGSRLRRGHDSLYRLEGNRIVYSMLEEKVIASLTEYREDLQRIGSEIDIASLSRNEQLAFWLNLHNVSIIEQIALAYPLVQPARLELDRIPMDRAKFITVAGISMSPHDIRTQIVYPNWSDPRVIYGFFRGDIGSPSVQREAYTAFRLSSMLDAAGEEFVNSLRGMERRGRILHVSRIYEEAAPFYFRDFEGDLRAHLGGLAKDDAKIDLDRTNGLEATIYEQDIADLAGGEHQTNYGNVYSSDGSVRSFRIPLTVQLFMAQRSRKISQLRKRGIQLWRVEVLPFDPDGTGITIETVE